ncbi:MAG: metal-sensing transcriptional repressor [Patescibacteria group bacterium]
MKTAEQRINNIIGQLEGAKKMLVSSERDCFSLIIQLKAIRSATSSLMESIISDEFSNCLLDKKIKNKENISRFFKEIINK